MNPSSGTVVAFNISRAKGTPKEAVEDIRFEKGGIVGDAHFAPGIREVSLLSRSSIQPFEEQTGRTYSSGAFAENITLEGIDLREVRVLDRFTINDAILEVTQIGKECHGDGCAIYRHAGTCIMPKEGVFCRVLQAGSAKTGDSIVYHHRRLVAHVITLSDRASKGIYEDASGMAVAGTLEEFFSSHLWQVDVKREVIPDEAALLQEKIRQALEANAHLLFTVGSTGVAPRDIAPDVIAPLCDRMIPGIMEHIRVKYGNINPNALLSRSICGIMGSTVVYTLPGSKKAVAEYLEEITKTIEHLILTQQGIQLH